MRVGFRNLVAKEKWNQSNLDAIWNIQQKAEKKAKENGIDVTYDRCMKVDHSMLID